MRKSVKQELIEYGVQRLNELELSNRELSEVSDVHHKLFNEDYYIIGYHESSEWLKKHDIDVFDGITFCEVQEEDNFGGCHTTKYENSELLVNHIVYWVGMQVIEEIIKEYQSNK
jgi:hypothetical protein